MNKLSICVMATLTNDKYKSQILGCRATWDKDAESNNIPVKYFCGNIKDDNFSFATHLENVGDDYYSATLKQYYGLQYLLKNHPSEFYMIVGTDTYINIERTLNMLKKYNYEFPFIIGGYGQTRNIFGFNVFFSLGGGGIFLSHSALNHLSPMFDNFLEKWNIETDKQQFKYLKPACDVSLYYLAWEERVTTVIEKDIYACSWAGYFYNGSNVIEHNFCGKINTDKMISCHFMEKEDMLLYRKWMDKGIYYLILKKQYEMLKNEHSDIKEHVETLYNYAKSYELILDCGFRPNLIPFIFGLLNNLNAKSRKITSVYFENSNTSEIVELAKHFDIEIELIKFQHFPIDLNANYDIIFIDGLTRIEEREKFIRINMKIKNVLKNKNISIYRTIYNRK